MNQTPGPEAKPLLIRAGALVKAVGASEPSLGVVEFTDSVGLLLAEGFQQDSHTGKLVLEAVQLARSISHEWRTADYNQVCLDERVCTASGKRGQPLRSIGCLSWQFSPVVVFISVQELIRLQTKLAHGRFEELLRFAEAHASGTPALVAALKSLHARRRARQMHPIQPKGESVRIALPQRPTRSDTVRLEIPPPPTPPSLQ